MSSGAEPEMQAVIERRLYFCASGELLIAL